MGTFLITAPDGKKYRVTGDTPEGAYAALQKMQAKAEPAERDADWRNDGQTGIREQSLSGFNEGLASIAGTPVDLITGAVNGGAGLLNQIAGTEFGAIERPFFGSEHLRDAMSPTIAEDEPQGAAQRYARSIGREAGASSLPMMGAARLGAPLTAGSAAMQGASIVGSGAGSQAARDVFPGNPYAEIAGQLVGGILPVGASYALRKGPAKPPTVQELDAQAKALYERGRTRVGADPKGVADLRQSMLDELRKNARVTPTGRVLADGNVKTFMNVLDDFDQAPMSAEQMQSVRTVLKDAAASADAGERRLGTAMLKKYDDWAAGYVPEYKEANAIYSRVKKSEDVQARIDKAERRANSTGTGGNAVNTSRQNIRQILDNPKARRGYTPAEVEQMEKIVRGSTAGNMMRLGGRLSPTSGALPLIANVMSTSNDPYIGTAAMLATQAMKTGAEAISSRQIQGLLDMIANDGPAAIKTMTDSERGILAVLAARGAAQAAP